ncbi:Sulfate transport system permease protein CysT [Gammaproteobacteria bacterium]
MKRIGAALQPGMAGVILLRGGVLTYVAILVVLPLASLVWHGLLAGPLGIWRAFTPTARDALILTLWTAALMATVNALMGTATAWVLVRYAFPGRGVLSALVDLPFAIPTLVTGIMLVLLLGPQSPAGGWLIHQGLPVAFAWPSIVLALLFVTLPFVVRAVEPVLLEQDPAEEEAAHTLGAGRFTVFWRILLPPMMPAILSGTIRSYARALGEFGSIVVVSGNIPHQTLTAPIYLFGEIEGGRPESAAAISLVLLTIALGLTFSARAIERLAGLSHA